MSALRVVTSDDLSEAPGSPGIMRQLAFEGEGFQILHAHLEPGTVSGWHHHGDCDVYGYVLAGRASFEGTTGADDVISVGTGEYFHVPAHKVHRDVNPSDTEDQEVILFLRGSGPMVVNVDDPNVT